MFPSPAAPPSVLIVDDAARIREVLVELLADEGYTAMAVANGQAALDYLHTHPVPYCIVLDLYMPIMAGWQFHRAQLRTPALLGRRSAASWSPPPVRDGCATNDHTRTDCNSHFCPIDRRRTTDCRYQSSSWATCAFGLPIGRMELHHHSARRY